MKANKCQKAVILRRNIIQSSETLPGKTANLSEGIFAARLSHNSQKSCGKTSEELRQWLNKDLQKSSLLSFAALQSF